jgi:enterobacterial common antigen flippase
MSSELSSLAATELVLPDKPTPVPAKKSTYGEILKSTTLVGGATALNVVIGIVRTKAMAVLLGPAGFGLMGMYTSIADLARSVAGMGINSSGVRQIAEAFGSGDTQRIARTVIVLRRAAIVLGILGALLLVLFARPISSLTFGTDAHAGAVALLSIAVFLQLIAAGQGALIQGMRRISDLAKIGVLGVLFGTLVSIPIVYYLREDGVVPALVAVAAMSTAISWWYSRKVRIEPCAMMRVDVRRETTSLLKLGLAFMASGLLMMGAAYVVRIILIRHGGLEQAGLYQAAWTLGGLYMGFVLQAMSADFYPRLVAVANDDAECNRLVNEQARVGLLLVGVGAIATLTFAPLVVSLFYSAAFEAAADTLRWICLGMTLRVVTWPMGYIIVARNEQVLFVATDVAWTVVSVGLAWLFVRWFGLKGAGIAFFASYVFHGVVIYPIVRKLSGFRWSAANIRLGSSLVTMIGVVFCSTYLLPHWWAVGLGSTTMVICGIYSANTLLHILSPD